MSIKILNHQLSKAAENLYNQVTSSLSKPVIFHPLNNTDVKNQRRYGALDPHQKDAYHIWLCIDLTGDVFEVNLFHELHHAQQIESGFPLVSNLTTQLFYSNEKFFSILGRQLQSFILDIDVWDWIKNNGMNIKYFTKRFYIGMKANSNIKYPNLADKYNYASFVCNYLLFFIYATDFQKNEILNSSVYHSNEVKKAYSISKHIQSIQCNTPLNAAKCIDFLLTDFNLWDAYVLKYHNIHFYSHENFNEYISKI